MYTMERCRHAEEIRDILHPLVGHRGSTRRDWAAGPLLPFADIPDCPTNNGDYEGPSG